MKISGTLTASTDKGDKAFDLQAGLPDDSAPHVITNAVHQMLSGLLNMAGALNGKLRAVSVVVEE